MIYKAAVEEIAGFVHNIFGRKNRPLAMELENEH